MAKFGKLTTEKVKDSRVDIISHFVPGPGFFLSCSGSIQDSLSRSARRGTIYIRSKR